MAISLGTIFGEVRLQMSGLQADADATKAMLADLSESIASSLSSVGAGFADDFTAQTDMVDTDLADLGAAFDDLAAVAPEDLNVIMDEGATSLDALGTAFEDTASTSGETWTGLAADLGDLSATMQQHFVDLSQVAKQSFDEVDVAGQEADAGLAASMDELTYVLEDLAAQFESVFSAMGPEAGAALEEVGAAERTAAEESGMLGGALDGLGERLSGALEHAHSFAIGMLEFQAMAGAMEAVNKFAGSLIGMNSEFESLHQQLTSITGSSGQADQILAWVKQFGQNIPDTTEHLAQAVVTIQSLGVNAQGVMPAIAGVAAAMGKDLPTASQAFADAYEGRWMMMQMQLHVTKDELVGFGLDIKHGAKGIQETLVPAFEKLQQAKFGNALQNQMQTLNGQLSNLTDRVQFFAMALGKPLFDMAKAGLGGLFSFLDEHKAQVSAFADTAGKGLAEAFRNVGKAAGEFFYLLGLAWPVVTLLLGGAKDLVTTFVEHLEPGFQMLAGVVKADVLPLFQNLGSTLKGGDVKGILAEMGTVAGRLGDVFSTGLKLGLDIVGTLFSDLVPVVKDLWPHLQTLGETVLNILGPLGGLGVTGMAIADSTKQWQGAMSDLLNVTDQVGPVIDQVVPLLGKLATLVADTLTQGLKNAAPFIKDLSDWVRTGLMPAVAAFLPHLMDLGKVLVNDVAPALGQIVLGAEKVALGIGAVLMPVLKGLTPLVFGLAGVLADVLGGLLHNLAPVIGQAAGALGQFAQDIGTRIAPIVTQFFANLQQVLGVLKVVWEAVWPQLSNDLQTAWGIIQGVVQIAWSIVSGIIKVGLDLLSGNWKQAWNDLKDALKGVWDGVVKIVDSAWKGLVNGFLSGVKTLLDAAGHIPGPLGDAARKGSDAIAKMQQDINKSTDDVAKKSDTHTKAAKDATAKNLAAMASSASDSAVRMKVAVLQNHAQMHEQAAAHAHLMAEEIKKQLDSTTDEAKRKSLEKQLAVVEAQGKEHMAAAAKAGEEANAIIAAHDRAKTESVKAMQDLSKAATDAATQKKVAVLQHVAQEHEQAASHAHLMAEEIKAAINNTTDEAKKKSLEKQLAVVELAGKEHTAAAMEAMHQADEVALHHEHMKTKSVQHAKDMHDGVLGHFQSLKDDAGKKMAEASTALSDKAHDAGQKVLDGFQWMYAHNTYFQDMVDGIHTTIDNAKKTISDDVTAVQTTVSAVWKVVQDDASAAWKVVHDNVLQPLQKAWTDVQTTVGGWSKWLGDRWSDISGTVSGWWGDMEKAVSSGIDTVKKALETTFLVPIENDLDLGKKALQWGQNLMDMFGQGIQNGVKGALGKAGDFMKGLAGLLGFHSPTEEGPGADADVWAPNLMKMFTQGILAGTPGVGAAASRVAGLLREALAEESMTATVGVAGLGASGVPSVGAASLGSGGDMAATSGGYGSGVTHNWYLTIEVQADGDGDDGDGSGAGDTPADAGLAFGTSFAQGVSTVLSQKGYN